MKGDSKKHGMCHVDVSIMVMLTYFELIQQLFKTEKQFESVDSLISLDSTLGIQIKGKENPWFWLCLVLSILSIRYSVD